jgi:hypothetical protein
MLITLALGLMAAGAITRVLMKIADARASVMIDHPESDWVDDQWRESQQGSPTPRSLSRSLKIRVRLGGSPDPLGPFPEASTPSGSALFPL